MSWPAAAAAAASVVDGASLTRALAAAASPVPIGSGDPRADARDEDLWTWVQQAFPVDRSVVNLNNGGVCPSPAVVMESLKRRLDEANLLPAYYLWQIQEPGKESNRAGLASLFGCDKEEIAITVAIQHPDVEALRITPNVYTTLEELDRFVEAMRSVAKNGLPKA